MKKDFTRDYVTEAFRLYARLGCPTYEQARRIVYDAEVERQGAADPQLAVIQAEKAVENQTPMLLDVLAVDRTLSILERGEKGHIAAAVKAVYFITPTLPLHKGEISERVRRHALHCPTDERTVYRWLKEARLLCAAVRGLRISEAEEKKYRAMV